MSVQIDNDPAIILSPSLIQENKQLLVYLIGKFPGEHRSQEIASSKGTSRAGDHKSKTMSMSQGAEVTDKLQVSWKAPFDLLKEENKTTSIIRQAAFLF